MQGEDSEMGWAHILWQRKGLDPFVFSSLDRRRKAFYIASEMVEMKKPISSIDIIAEFIKMLGKKKK